MSNSKIRAALRQKEVQRQRQGSRRALLTASHHLQIAQIADVTEVRVDPLGNQTDGPAARGPQSA